MEEGLESAADAARVVSADVVEAGGVAIDALARAVARAQAASSLFGQDRSVLVGRYRLLELVGSGGMGVVWSAHDPELGRTVALKLASTGSEDARARVRAEGRVLAKLSHPNVVPIYDVLDSEHGVFLVMELVRGQTLRAFAEEALRRRAARWRWRRSGLQEVVRAYREAAAGLGAAHRAGLVHRDFKPDNAVVGADGRVRVLDFGLAVDIDGRAVGVAGTPRYMAPEQRAGQASAAADQYAFCASLREALGDALPRWLAPILARGTATEPSARFRSMAELSTALGRDPAALWRRRGSLGVAAAAVAVGVMVGRQYAQAPRPTCDGGAALIAASWGDERAAQVAHLMALSGAYVERGRTQLIAGLDRYAQDWSVKHRASCQAQVRGTISTPQFDRRGRCLAHGRAALATVARLAGAVQPAQLPGLIEAAAALPELARCIDDDALATPVAPPPAAVVERVAAVERQLSELAVLRDAGRLDEAEAIGRLAVEAAATLGYVPLIARAHLARGRIALSRGVGDRGADDLAVALRAALASGDDSMAVEAFARHAFAIAAGSGTNHTIDGLSLIEPISERLSPQDRFARALLQGTLGGIALAEGDRDRARAHFHRAVDLAEQVTGPRAFELAFVRHGEVLLLDDPDEVARRSAAMIAAREAQLGGHHPLTLRDRVSVATLAPDDAQVFAAIAAPCRELASHPAVASWVAECSAEAVLLAALAGDREALREWAPRLERAVASQRSVALLRRAKAFGLLAAGESRAALAEFRAARAELPLGPTARFWIRGMAVELALGGAAAAGAVGDRAARSEELAVARAQLAACRDDLATPLARRRLAEIAALAATDP